MKTLKIFFVCVVLLLSGAVKAKDVSNPATTGKINVNSVTVGVTKQEIKSFIAPAGVVYPNDASWADDYVFDKLQGELALSLITDHSAFPQQFACEVTFSVKYYTFAFTSAQTEVIKLDVSYDKRAGLKYKEKDLKVIEGAYYMEITVSGISNTSVKQHLQFEGIIREARYNNTLLSTTPTLSVTLNSTTNTIDVAIGNQVIESADEYDLEWTIADAYSNIPTSLFLLSDAVQYNFTNNSTRVTLSDPLSGYKLSNVFSLSYVVFRVRAVTYVNDRKDRLCSPWSLMLPAGLVSSATGAYAAIDGNKEHEPLKNWQYMLTFAEEGKSKEVVTYYDGSMRNRQTVTRNNSDQTIVVGESVYDYTGRAAIDFLPAPAFEKDGNDNYYAARLLKYYPKFNQNAAGAAYSKEDFDKDPVGTCNGVAAAAGETSGAGLYYADENPVNDESISLPAFQKYVPVASGFPFVQKEFMADNTGRVRTTSMPGEKHQIKSDGHYTKYMYETPAQAELDMMFGNEVGNAYRYKKNSVIDPNGQVSISYLNAGGKVIATALSGDAPAGMEKMYEGSAPLYNFDIDINTPDNVSLSKGAIIASKTFTVIKAGTYSFKYQVNANALNGLCRGDKEYEASFNLAISLVDECGKEWITSSNQPIGKDFDGNYSFAGDGMTTTDGYIEIGLPVGTYHISKTLKVDEQKLRTYEEDFIKDFTCKTKESFIDEAKAKMDLTLCISTCADCTSKLGTETDYVNARKAEYADPLNAPLDLFKATYAQLVLYCADICKEEKIDVCKAYRDKMLIDVSPGGQYARYEVNDEGVIQLPAEETHSLLFAATGFTYYYADEPALKDIDVTLPDGTEKKVSELTVKQFIDAWKEEWAEILIAYHPEKKDLDWCDKMNIKEADKKESVNSFELELMMPETFAEASAYTGPFTTPSGPNPNVPLVPDPSATDPSCHPVLTSCYNDNSEFPPLATCDPKSSDEGTYARHLFYNDPALADFYTTDQHTILQPEKDDMMLNLSQVYKETYSVLIDPENPAAGSVERTDIYNLYEIPIAATFCSAVPQEERKACVEANKCAMLSCEGYRNFFWTITRSIYLSERQKMLTVAKKRFIGGTFTVIPGKKVRVFGDVYNEDWLTEASMPGLTLAMIATQLPSINDPSFTTPLSVENDVTINQRAKYAEQCESYKPYWREKLKGCSISTEAKMNHILEGLWSVCVNGADQEHPLGSSNVPPSRRGHTPVSLNNFNEVLRFALLRQGIDETPYQLGICDEYLISMPMPYDHDYLATNDPEANTCTTCDPQTEACCDPTPVVPGQINPEVKKFVAYTKDVAPADKCKTCITCDNFAAIYQAFETKYGPEAEKKTDLKVNFQDLFTNFLNANSKFNLKYEDYINFAQNCLAESVPLKDVLTRYRIKFLHTTGHASLMQPVQMNTFDPNRWMLAINDLQSLRRMAVKSPAAKQSQLYSPEAVAMSTPALWMIDQAQYRGGMSAMNDFGHIPFLESDGITTNTAIQKTQSIDIMVGLDMCACDNIKKLYADFLVDNQNKTFAEYVVYVSAAAGKTISLKGSTISEENAYLDALMDVCDYAYAIGTGQEWDGPGKWNNGAADNLFELTHGLSAYEVDCDLSCDPTKYTAGTPSGGCYSVLPAPPTGWDNTGGGNWYPKVTDPPSIAPVYFGCAEMVTWLGTFFATSPGSDIKTHYESYVSDPENASASLYDYLASVTNTQSSDDLKDLYEYINAHIASLPAPVSPFHNIDEFLLKLKACTNSGVPCSAVTATIKSFLDVHTEIVITTESPLIEQLQNNSLLSGELLSSLNTNPAISTAPLYFKFDLVSLEAKLKECNPIECRETDPNAEVINPKGYLDLKEAFFNLPANIEFKNKINSDSRIFRDVILANENEPMRTAFINYLAGIYVQHPYHKQLTERDFVRLMSQCKECEGCVYDKEVFLTDMLNTLAEEMPGKRLSGTPALNKLVATNWSVSGFMSYFAMKSKYKYYDPASLQYKREVSDEKFPVSGWKIKVASGRNRDNPCKWTAYISNGVDEDFELELTSIPGVPGIISSCCDATNPANSFAFSRIISFSFIDAESEPALEDACSANASVIYNYRVTYTIPGSTTLGTCIVQAKASAFPFVSYKKCSTDAYNGPLLCNKPFGEIQVALDETPCEKEKRLLAEYNGQQAYLAYLQQQKDAFREAYIKKCMEATEVFKMKYKASMYHFTLYYYDQAGNLVKTVPPAGVALLNNTGIANAAAYRNNGTGSAVYPTHTYTTIYQYNTLQQLLQQTTPDAGTSKFWYDKLGRLVLSQNAKQAFTKYSYTIYDDLNRITEVGEASSLPNSVTNLWNYTMDAFLGSAARTEITQTWYDRKQTGTAFPGGITQENLRGRVAHSVYKTVAGDAYLHGVHYSYDIHGNVKQLYRENTGVEVADQEIKVIRYQYDLISGKVNMVTYQPDEADQYVHRYTYDADNRLTEAESGEQQLTLDRDAYYRYYLHGPLARMEAGYHAVQGVDYVYTVHGWLKSVNSATLKANRDPGGDNGTSGATDIFGFSLGYYNGDYQPVAAIAATDLPEAAVNGSTSINDVAKDLFNGNIRYMSVAIKPFEKMLSAYQYDQLNRLRKAVYFNGVDIGSNVWQTLAPELSAYKNEFTYDANGNIRSQMRNGAASQVNMDNLVYNYVSGTNKLDYVSDSRDALLYNDDIDGQTSGNYDYDAIGNLKKDRSEDITAITWNVYGKISRIQYDATSGKPDIEYQYTPDGHRAVKIVTPKALQYFPTYTYYVRDAQGNIMATYERKMRRIVDYERITFSQANTSLTTIAGATAFQSFIGNLHGADAATKLDLYNAISATSTGAADFLKAMSPAELLASDALALEYVLDNITDAEFKEGVRFKPNYRQLLCAYMENTNPTGLRFYKWSMQYLSSSQLSEYIVGMYYTNNAGFMNLYNHFSMSWGNYDVVFPTKTPADRIAALESFDLDDCEDIVPALGYFNTIPKVTPVLLEDVQSTGGIFDNVSELVYYLYNTNNTANKQQIWQYIFDYYGSADAALAALRDNRGQVFMSEFARQKRSDLDSYQQSHNTLYSATANMETYFAKIRELMGQSVHDQMTLSYYNLWKTYIDKVTLSEHHLYGSSRTGIRVSGKQLYSLQFVDADGNGFPDEDPAPVEEYAETPDPLRQSIDRGNRRYEMTNHLGNVLAVVSDKRIYETDQPVLNSVFDGSSLDGWVDHGNAIGNAGGKLHVTCGTCNLPNYTGVLRYFDVKPATTYHVEFDYEEVNDVKVVSHVIPNPYVPVTFGGDFNITATGHISYDFTTDETTTSVRMYVGPDSQSDAPDFYIDNVTITEKGKGYVADILQVTDYSPFGAPLPERTLDVVASQNRETKVENKFETPGNVEGWVALDPNSSVAVDDGRLKFATTHTAPVRAQKTFATTPGKKYRISADIEITAGFSNSMFFEVVNNTYTNIFRKKDHYELEFIANATSANVQLNYGYSGTREGYIDNVKFEEVVGEEPSYRFGFNGMEQDNETYGTGNAYDFGARVYDARLGRWMSLDPLQAKYPGQSPYSFTANNPIIYKDVDGRDYVLVIDHKAKTITVVATYYVTEGNATDMAAAQKGVATWNSASGVYSYKVGYGQNATEYKINFDLKVKEAKDPVAAANADASGNSFVINTQEVEKSEKPGEKDNGITINGKHIAVKEKRADDTEAHEIGHTLGLSHFIKGFMQEVSIASLKNVTYVLKGYVQEILKDRSLGIKPDMMDGEEGEARKLPPEAKGSTEVKNPQNKPADFTESGDVDMSFPTIK